MGFHTKGETQSCELDMQGAFLSGARYPGLFCGFLLRIST